MAVELYDAVNHDGLFDLLGKAFKAQGDLNTARGTTVPASVIAVLDQFEKLTTTTALASVPAAIPGALQSYVSSGSGLAQTLSAYCANLLIEMVNADTRLSRKTLSLALQELIKQMQSASASVEKSTIALTVTAGSSNNNNGAVVKSTKRGDGLVQEHSIAETFRIDVTNDATPETASLSLTGTLAASDLLSSDWPLGSGMKRSISAIDAASSLISNGDFETTTVVSGMPDDWIVSVGTPGTHLYLTTIEVQTVAITGTPTGGTYLLAYTNPSGKVQYTEPLAYNASASDVQSALQALEGLGSVTVSSSGSSPNYTHSVTFYGAGGNVTILSSVNRLTGGSSPTITHGTTTAGTSQVFKGSYSLACLGNGSTLTAFQQRLSNLKSETAYAVSLWAICDVVPAAGVVTVDLVDGIGGSVIQDKQGTNNSFTFNASSLTTSWKHLTTLVSGECVFRMPTIVPPLVYLRIRQSTAISSGTIMFLDHVALAEMTEIYDGGPLLAVFSGSNDMKVGDYWTVAVTNDRAGLVNEWCNRNFNLASLGLLLPSSSSPTIPDSVAT